MIDINSILNDLIAGVLLTIILYIAGCATKLILQHPAFSEKFIKLVLVCLMLGGFYYMTFVLQKP